jgi:propionyl-CoA synthetase
MTLAAVRIGAVIGMKDEFKGEAPCALHRAQGRRQPPADRDREGNRALVREKIGPVAAFKIAITVARLPKTRSGKILRGTMKKIADGDQWTMPATIDDPAILGEIGSALKGHGIGG